MIGVPANKMIVVPKFRGHRLEIVAQLGDGAWNAGIRIRRTLSEMKPHVDQVTCRKPTAIEAEARAAKSTLAGG
jgi:hypothetical protein